MKFNSRIAYNQTQIKLWIENMPLVSHLSEIRRIPRQFRIDWRVFHVDLLEPARRTYRIYSPSK